MSRSVVIITVVLMGMVGSGTASALDGSGTEGDPWLIQSLEDFNDFASDPNYWDDYTRLETDVNLAGRVYDRAVIAPDVNNDVDTLFQGTFFAGIFDGNDHKILGLTINDGGAGNDYLGLFGYIDGGEVRNLGLKGGFVSGDNMVGGVVGQNIGSVLNCYYTGTVSGTGVFAGGLIGANNNSVSDCYSTGDVNGVYDVGGLAGGNVGGVSNCYSIGDVSGANDVGGLVGENNGRVWDCYSTGGVNGVDCVGGLMGRNSDDVWNCYSTGDVNGVNYYAGGLMGRSVESVWNCFWDTDTQTHGVTESIGYQEGTVDNVSGLTTTQMQARSTFTDATWDFIGVWNIGENQTYPYLRTVLPSDLNKDRITNFLDIAILCEEWLIEE